MFWKKKKVKPVEVEEEKYPEPLREGFCIKCEGIDKFRIVKVKIDPSGMLRRYFSYKSAVEAREDDSYVYFFSNRPSLRFVSFTLKTKEEAKDLIDKIIAREEREKILRQKEIDFIKNNPPEWYP